MSVLPLRPSGCKEKNVKTNDRLEGTLDEEAARKFRKVALVKFRLLVITRPTGGWLHRLDVDCGVEMRSERYYFA